MCASRVAYKGLWAFTVNCSGIRLSVYSSEMTILTSHGNWALKERTATQDTDLYTIIQSSDELNHSHQVYGCKESGCRNNRISMFQDNSRYFKIISFNRMNEI